nr:hypothetical protein B0A51_07896 [Rachicladosporium sp. CCFEE 5018]
MRVLSILVTIVGLATALPKFSNSIPDLEEYPAFEEHSPIEEQAVRSALVRRKSSKPAEEPPKGTYRLEHPDADDPVVQHLKHKKIMDLHPYDNDQNMCTNEKHYWLPKEEHTEPLGYKVDDCRNRWSEDISPADHSINPKDCWDCSKARLDGCTKDDWDAIDNLKNHALSNYDGMTATPLPTATPAARSLALTSDGSFGGVEASVETAVSMTSVPAVAARDGGIGDAIATMGPPLPTPSS